MKWTAFLAAAAAFGASTASSQQAAAPAAGAGYVITPIAERRVPQLPTARPLYWRIETFASLEAAAVHEGDYALAATVDDRHWLFTLGARHGATPGASRVAEIGPVPVAAARTYLLRINHAGGPPGWQTPVHSHPGAEAIYVLSGEVTRRTRHGTETAAAGSALKAHEAEMAMQLQSTGRDRLSQLVMFAVDADRPFSPPAQF